MKIAIVNDMPMAVEALRRAVAFEPAHQVIWVASNGAEALQRCTEQLPDLILMDLIMPVMDGVEATRRIMAETPCAIVIVTVDRKQNVHRVFEAMGHGALDVVDTPALEVLLKGLPAAFPAAIVLVQHVDQVFAAGMAEWLSSAAGLPVRLACEGEPPQPGQVLLAGTNHHIRLLQNGQLAYTAEPVNAIYRPSIDVFFESVARHWSGDAVGVLLTGMGRDGAQGLKLMRQQGFLTIAQDQASCAVYGMPKAAVAIDAAVEIRPLERIAGRLTEIFAK
ncbi:chemotaxis response regulator protein-glutamate methylesterase [Pseudomonas inefficax]|uniref:chemotaxis response regulator protein-glutamate methylesterase n=1 Tax=Pseudomonas inefficax TaxID=2078786 RepID=UPI004046E29E